MAVECRKISKLDRFPLLEGEDWAELPGARGWIVQLREVGSKNDEDGGRMQKNQQARSVPSPCGRD
ncbi:hypothetical protein BSQ40_15215, partial [Serratia fonticola]